MMVFYVSGLYVSGLYFRTKTRDINIIIWQRFFTWLWRWHVSHDNSLPKDYLNPDDHAKQIDKGLYPTKTKVWICKNARMKTSKVKTTIMYR